MKQIKKNKETPLTWVLPTHQRQDREDHTKDMGEDHR